MFGTGRMAETKQKRYSGQAFLAGEDGSQGVCARTADSCSSGFVFELLVSSPQQGDRSS